MPQCNHQVNPGLKSMLSLTTVLLYFFASIWIQCTKKKINAPFPCGANKSSPCLPLLAKKIHMRNFLRCWLSFFAHCSLHADLLPLGVTVSLCTGVPSSSITDHCPRFDVLLAISLCSLLFATRAEMEILDFIGRVITHCISVIAFKLFRPRVPWYPILTKILH